MRGPCGAERLVGPAVIEIAVHKIGDDLDGMLHGEFVERLFFKIVRYGRHAVALLDGKPSDRQIAAVASDERDISAVERGDEGQAFRGGHGAREIGADGVRNRVVNVEKVELLGFGDFEHFCGERECVGRVVE